jgi:hypothetical protein
MIFRLCGAATSPPGMDETRRPFQRAREVTSNQSQKPNPETKARNQIQKPKP